MFRLAFLIAGLLFLLYLTLQIGPQNIVSLVLNLGWNVLWIALIYSVYELIRAGALWKSLPEGTSQPYLKMLEVRLSGEAVRNLTFTGPFVGEPMKAWLLRKKGLPAAGAFAAIITEYLIYTFAAAAMGIAGLCYVLDHIQLGREISVAARVIAYSMAVFLIASAIAIIFRIYLIGAIINGISKLPLLRRRTLWSPAGVREMEDLLLKVLRERPRRFATIFALDGTAHVLLMLELYWIVTSSGISLRMFQAFLIEAVTKFMTLAFFFVPMQVGVAEGTYGVVFQVMGLPVAAGVAMSLVRRLRTLIVSGVGLMTLAHLTGISPPSTPDG